MVTLAVSAFGGAPKVKFLFESDLGRSKGLDCVVPKREGADLDVEPVPKRDIDPALELPEDSRAGFDGMPASSDGFELAGVVTVGGKVKPPALGRLEAALMSGTKPTPKGVVVDELAGLGVEPPNPKNEMGGVGMAVKGAAGAGGGFGLVAESKSFCTLTRNVVY